MKTVYTVLAFGVLVAALAGCLPQERIVWSPDGGAAAVLSGEKLLLCNPQGKLTGVADGIAAVNWMSDSKRLLVVRKKTLTTWKDAAAILPDSRQQEIAQAAGQLRDQLLAFQGDLDKFHPELAPDQRADAGLMCLWLRDNGGAGLAEKLGKKDDVIRNAKAEVYDLAICPAEASAKIGPTLATALTCQNPQASPDGKAVSYHGDIIDQPQAERALIVAPADGGGPARVVAKAVAVRSAWSPDGKYLAYVAADGGGKGQDALRLGTVSRCKVVGDDGRLLDAQAVAQADLAGVLYHEDAMAAYLPDGRILFTSAQVDLPATGKDMPQQMSLFAVDPAGPTVQHMLPRQTLGQLGDALMYFALSPDGRQVAILGPKGGLNVVSLQTGDVQPILAEGAAKLPAAVPAWRSATELSFIAPPGSQFNAGSKAELVLLKLAPGQPAGPSTPLSADWPQDVRTGLLDEKLSEPQSQPAAK